MAWVVPILAMFATAIALARRSAREADAAPLVVDEQRLVDGHGVVVLREHVARLVVRWPELVVDTVHGQTRRVTLPTSRDGARLLASIHAHWPELGRFDAHTLVRLVERKNARRVARRTWPPRPPFSLTRPHDADGYRDAGSHVWTLRYGGTTSWTITAARDTWLLEREGGGVVSLHSPVVLVQTRDFALRVVTGDRDVVLPCTSERDAREALRLTRQLLDEAS